MKKNKKKFQKTEHPSVLIIYFFDTVPDPGEWRARMVNVSSPKRENYKQYQKYPNVVTYYMPVWNYDEFMACWTEVFSSFKLEEFHRKFLLFGGIPRSIFSQNDAEFQQQQALAR